MNSFFLCTDVPADGQCTMVIPEGPAEEGEEEKYYLVGFATPLTDGARRAARALAGYTPLYKSRSHPDLWQMQTKVVGAWVGGPYMGCVEFFGCE